MGTIHPILLQFTGRFKLERDYLPWQCSDVWSDKHYTASFHLGHIYLYNIIHAYSNQARVTNTSNCIMSLFLRHSESCREEKSILQNYIATHEAYIVKYSCTRAPQETLRNMVLFAIAETHLFKQQYHQ